MEKLDSEKIKSLLEEADKKWFMENRSGYDYQKHLTFSAEHVANNYYKNGRRKREKP